MKRWKKIKEHFKQGGTIIWNDPDPIDGNDYKLSYLEDLDEVDSDTPILIQYNAGGSEAQVFLHELKIIK